MWVGTPGRQASVKKSASGTTTTSIRANNAENQEHVAREQIRKSNPNATPEELEVKVKASVKSSTDGQGDTGNLVADHTSYAGTSTVEVHGDDCKVVDGDKVVNVDGDYFLKVTGDCHIEVGGGFFFGAEGSPKVADKDGELSLIHI